MDLIRRFWAQHKIIILALLAVYTIATLILIFLSRGNQNEAFFYHVL